MAKPNRPSLLDDPELAAFFRAIDLSYGLDPLIAPAPSEPTPGPKPIREQRTPEPSYIRPDPIPLQRTPSPSSIPIDLPRPLQQPPKQESRPELLPDPDLLALAQIWHRLSRRDRREVLWLVRLKLELPDP